MLGCVIVMFLIGLPRLILAAVWLLTGWFGAAYETWIWPILGWFFMPYTTAAYMAAMLHNEHQLTGGWAVLVVVAVLFDLGAAGSSGRVSVRTRAAARRR